MNVPSLRNEEVMEIVKEAVKKLSNRSSKK